MDFCAAPETTGFVSSMVHFVDCEAQTLGSAPYQALSAPGSTLSIVLSGFLTIFVALIGYNLLLGRNYTIRDGTLAAVKIGAVFALATSWPVYRTLVYELVIDGPAEIVGDIGRPAGVSGSDGTVLQKLDDVDAAMAQLAVLGAGPLPSDLQDSNGRYVAPPPFAGFNAFALGGSRILFLITAIAGLAAVRAIAALMLALGPFFIAFLMFDNTRGLFEGWIRVLAGAALATIGVTITLGMQLTLVEPWLANVIARRIAGEGLPSVPTELLAITCVFAILVLAIVAGCMRLTRSFRLAPLVRQLEGRSHENRSPRREPSPPRAMPTAQHEWSRARVVADTLMSLQRREEGGRLVLRGPSGPAPRLTRGDTGGFTTSNYGQAGRSFRRSSQRASASAGKRDSR
jgi:type IV secretion system protein VirB6